MKEDIAPQQAGPETSQTQGGISSIMGGGISGMKGKMVSKISPYIGSIGVGGVVMIGFLVGLAIAFSFVRLRDPAPTTYAGGYNGQEDITGSLGFPAGIDEVATAACIEDYIRSKEPRSPFLTEVTGGVGKRFIDSGKAAGTNGVNPALMLAIAVSESSLATAGIAVSHPTLHNYYGYTATAGEVADGKGEEFDGVKWRKFGSWEEAITEQGQYMRRMYLSQGATTLIAIRNIYAPPRATNDPSNLNRYWATNTTKTIKEISAKCPALAIETGTLGYNSLGSEFYLSQGDPAWNYPAFTDGARYFPVNKSFASAGCGATSAAMVVRYLTNDKSVTPITTAEKFLSCDGGWAAFSESCFIKGINGKEITGSRAEILSQIRNQIEKKHPVILHIKDGYKNPKKRDSLEHTRGHYVVIKAAGIEFFNTADPSGSDNEEYSTDFSKYPGGVEFFYFYKG